MNEIVDRKVNIDVLYQFAMNRKRVNEWDLTHAAECLYRSAKITGINETIVKYYDNTETIGFASDCPERARAFAAFIVRLIYRWDDIQSGRLERHFGLSMDTQSILADTNIFQKNGTDLACVTVKQVIDTWAIDN